MKREAMLYKRLENGSVACDLCAHRCVITDGKFGICGVRQNSRGVLYTLVYAEAIADHVDPIEKKPFYHFLPGSNSYSIATVGCNFRCGFCQNWRISQASKRDGLGDGYELRPEKVVREAIRNRCASISYTYTEPTIFFEYAYDTARIAKEKGLYNTFVTNGFMTGEALRTIEPFLDACNVDLKFASDKQYRDICKGRLEPVLDSIRCMRQLGIWVEVTTLVVPGENDSHDDLTWFAGSIAGIDKMIPWHISRFHPDYKFTDSVGTPVDTLKKARSIGERAGLRYVYLGNVLEGTDTICYNCGEIVLRRGSLRIGRPAMKQGLCPRCSVLIDGVWG